MNIATLVWTELRQNAKLTVTLLAVSLTLGASAHFAIELNSEIQKLVRPEHWAADMAILPKGITLSTLATELRTGAVKEYLPEALFHSTVDITQGEVRLSAVLPVHEADGGIAIATQGDRRFNFAGWGVRVVDWREQKEHGTPEWGSKVIAAAFASGSTPMLEKLKELIDRKTVAQAVWIDEAQRASLELQNTLSSLAGALEMVLLSSLIVSLALAGSLLFQRHQETQRCLRDLGWSRGARAVVLFGLAVTLLLIPLGAGYGILPADTVSSHLNGSLSPH